MSDGHHLRHASQGADPKKIISDFSELHLSWFLCSQENTSDRQPIIMFPWKELSLSQVKRSWVSKAYDIILAPWASARVASGDIYRLKRVGLKTDSWGTPTCIWGMGAENGRAQTVCWRFDKKEVNQVSTVPPNPHSSSLLRSRSWGTVSKAADRSNNIRMFIWVGTEWWSVLSADLTVVGTQHKSCTPSKIPPTCQTATVFDKSTDCTGCKEQVLIVDSFFCRANITMLFSILLVLKLTFACI